MSSDGNDDSEKMDENLKETLRDILKEDTKDLYGSENEESPASEENE